MLSLFQLMLLTVNEYLPLTKCMSGFYYNLLAHAKSISILFDVASSGGDMS